MVNANSFSRITSPRPTEAFTRHVFGCSGGSAGAPCWFGKAFYKHAAPTGRRSGVEAPESFSDSGQLMHCPLGYLQCGGSSCDIHW
jgi:hypothetical protein